MKDNVHSIAETVKVVLETMDIKEKSTTQLVKARTPPIWCRQKFYRWKKEIERWSENNISIEEDLLESDILRIFYSKLRPMLGHC